MLGLLARFGTHSVWTAGRWTRTASVSDTSSLSWPETWRDDTICTPVRPGTRPTSCRCCPTDRSLQSSTCPTWGASRPWRKRLRSAIRLFRTRSTPTGLLAWGRSCSAWTQSWSAIPSPWSESGPDLRWTVSASNYQTTGTRRASDPLAVRWFRNRPCFLYPRSWWWFVAVRRMACPCASILTPYTILLDVYYPYVAVSCKSVWAVLQALKIIDG